MNKDAFALSAARTLQGVAEYHASRARHNRDNGCPWLVALHQEASAKAARDARLVLGIEAPTEY